MFTPEFFLVGAPKSGTTALYTYLRAHRDLFLPELKEPHYFSSDLGGFRPIDSEEAYQRLYRDRGVRVCGDASASYLYSSTAVPTIRKRHPAARFVAILRNPILAAQAMHEELVFNLTENVTSFETAWRLQPERAGGRALPRDCRDPKLLQYHATFAYGEQLSRLGRIVPEEDRLILLYDDLRLDPAASYRRILAFLGVKNDGRESFPKVNAAKELRSVQLARWHRAAPRRLGAIYAPAKWLANQCGVYPSRILERWNVASRPREMLSEQFAGELLTDFESDIRAVEGATGRSLGSWRSIDTAGRSAK
jgi:hypothetical protein